MSDFNNKLVIDLFEERDELRAENEALKKRIQSLIEERDRANRLAEWKWNLRDEFQLLLGTDKIEEGIEVVKELKRHIKKLEEAGDAMASAWDKEWLTEADIEAIIDDWHGAKEDKP